MPTFASTFESLWYVERMKASLLHPLLAFAASALIGSATTAFADTTTPERLEYVAGQPIPAGYHLSSHSEVGLVVSGSVIFGVLYGISVVAAAWGSQDSSAHHGDSEFLWFAVPCVGPFIYAANTSNAKGTAIADGIGQIAGLAAFFVGFALTKLELVRTDVATLQVVPVLGRDRSGLSVVALF
jgi:hypothetical protein